MGNAPAARKRGARVSGDGEGGRGGVGKGWEKANDARKGMGEMKRATEKSLPQTKTAACMQAGGRAGGQAAAGWGGGRHLEHVLYPTGKVRLPERGRGVGGVNCRQPLDEGPVQTDHGPGVARQRTAGAGVDSPKSH